MNIKKQDEISLQWLFKQAGPNRWDLANIELASLLGIDEELIKKLQDGLELGEPLELTNDTSTRLSLLLAIHKAIHELSPYGEEYTFFISPNNGDFLKGMSIKEFLIKETSKGAMSKVITWLKSI
jgi:hypothetical protein